MKTAVGHYTEDAAKYHKLHSESIKVDSMQSTIVRQQQQECMFRSVDPPTVITIW